MTLSYGLVHHKWLFMLKEIDPSNGKNAMELTELPNWASSAELLSYGYFTLKDKYDFVFSFFPIIKPF